MRSSVIISALLAFSPLALAQDRRVFAHWMLGLAPDSLWDSAIRNAKAAGIDGFALNTGPTNPDAPAALRAAYAAAERAGSFGMFISFDMGCCGDFSVDMVANWINTYKGSSAQIKVDGKPFHSTFEGFNWAGRWPEVKSRTGDLYLVPSWTYNGGVNGVAQNLDKVNGAFNWDAWPANRGLKDTQGDRNYINMLGSKAYMMGVSPWMYTNIQGTNYAKNWILQSDTLWYDRWEQVLDLLPRFVEIITWNDYGESHYIGDLSEGYIPPEMQYFVNGIPHTAWQAVLPYYISAYKAGRRDVTIPTEGAVFWYRNTPKFTCSNGGTNCGSNSGIPATDCVEDAVFVLTLSNSATTVNVLIGGSGQTFNVAKGAKLVKMPFNGRTGQVQVSIKGKTGTGPAPITNICPAAGKVNFNPLVGKAM